MSAPKPIDAPLVEPIAPTMGAVQPRRTYSSQQTYSQQDDGYFMDYTDQQNMKLYTCLDDIMNSLMQDPEAEKFQNPLQSDDPNEFQRRLPQQMDLNTVKEKLRSGNYKNIAAFAADVRLIWENAFKYNRITSTICRQAASMSKKFEKLMEERLLTPFRIAVHTQPQEQSPPPVAGILKRPKKLYGTALGDFRKMPRHIMQGGRENHRLLPLKKCDYTTNSYLTHIRVEKSKKTFYTSRYAPYPENDPLTRIASDFNYFYSQYCDYWANQKQQEQEAAQQEQAPAEEQPVTDEQWAALQQIEGQKGQNFEAQQRQNVDSQQEQNIEGHQQQTEGVLELPLEA